MQRWGIDSETPQQIRRFTGKQSHFVLGFTRKKDDEGIRRGGELRKVSIPIAERAVGGNTNTGYKKWGEEAKRNWKKCKNQRKDWSRAQITGGVTCT